MKFQPKRSKLWRTLGVIGASLLTVGVAGSHIASKNSASIDYYLNTSHTKIIEKKDGETKDSQYFKSSFKNNDDLQKYLDGVGEDIVKEGSVLLKNNNQALPLNKNDKITLLGQGSYKTNYSTSGSSSTSGVSYPKLSNVLKEGGFTINPKALAFGEKNYGENGTYIRNESNLIKFINEAPWSSYDSDTISSFSDYGDAVIVTFARDSGEGVDISTTGSDGEDGTYLSLSSQEKELLQQLTILKNENKIKKIIVLLNTACPIQTDFMFDSSISVDSAMWIGNLGSKGIYGLKNLLLGEANPSGKLNDTFLKNNLTSPAMSSWMTNKDKSFALKYSNSKTYKLNQTQTYYGTYSEGIYVGYRYYETRYEDSVLKRSNVGDYKYTDDVSYPFGYGLSYTTFSYNNFNAVKEGDNIKVTLTVTNTGSKYSGKEAVEIYLQKPYTDYDIENGVEKASVELVGYTKTSLLEPGKSEDVTINIDFEEFKSYDANKTRTYILDAGDYYLTAANGAHEAINNILSKKGATCLDKEGNSSLAKVVYTQDKLDITTFSTSKETGKVITNQFDFMDINKYENKGDNKITYVSRNDWQGTWPTESVILSINDKMYEDLTSHKTMNAGDAKMPTYGKSTNLKLINLRNNDENKIAYNDPLWDELLDSMTSDEQAELIVNSAFNTPGITSIGKPKTVDTDGPTGTVNTKTGTVLPSLGLWASSYNKELQNKIGVALGEDCLNAGVNSLYAPGVNLHRTPFGGRLNEYFSEDSYLTGMAAGEFVKGIQSKGVIPTVKHYAFNNEESKRNGIAIWMNEQEARELMLKPFEMVMCPSKANVHAIMTSFNRAGAIWTSASRELMINVSRDEWGFDGYSITDMASANGASYMVYDDGIFNGTDIFLGNGTASDLNEYKTNPAYAQRMREACHRVLYVICNYSSAMNGITTNTEFVRVSPWWEVLINGIVIGAIALTVISLVMVFITYYFRAKAQN